MEILTREFMQGEAIVSEYEYGDYGLIRWELLEDVILVHPKLFKTTATYFKRLKDDMHNRMEMYKTMYGHNLFMTVTHNSKLANMLTNGKAEAVGTLAEGVVYIYDIK